MTKQLAKTLSIIACLLPISCGQHSSSHSKTQSINVDSLGASFGFTYKPDLKLQQILNSDDELMSRDDQGFWLIENPLVSDDLSLVHPSIRAYAWDSQIVDISSQNGYKTLDLQLIPGTRINSDKHIEFELGMTITEWDDAIASLPGKRSLFVKGIFAVKQPKIRTSTPITLEGEIECGATTLVRKTQTVPATILTSWTNLEIDMIIPDFDFADCRQSLEANFKLNSEFIRFSQLSWGLSKVEE